MNNLLAFGESDINQIQTAAGVKPFSGNLATLVSGQKVSVTMILFFIAGAAFVFYMISGGIKLMTSAGDPRAVGEAKQTITNAFVGLVIVIVAYWIVQLVGTILGLEGVQGTF